MLCLYHWNENTRAYQWNTYGFSPAIVFKYLIENNCFHRIILWFLCYQVKPTVFSPKPINYNSNIIVVEHCQSEKWFRYADYASYYYSGTSIVRYNILFNIDAVPRMVFGRRSTQLMRAEQTCKSGYFRFVFFVGFHWIRPRDLNFRTKLLLFLLNRTKSYRVYYIGIHNVFSWRNIGW